MFNFIWKKYQKEKTNIGYFSTKNVSSGYYYYRHYYVKNKDFHRDCYRKSDRGNASVWLHGFIRREVHGFIYSCTRIRYFASLLRLSFFNR
jgi:hypothetical protein